MSDVATDTPITILDLARYRLEILAIPHDPEHLNGRDFADVGLPIMGGCGICSATVAAYNSCPSKDGYLRCRNGCIGDDGWTDVTQANDEIFGED
jgi:hypothetical protein